MEAEGDVGKRIRKEREKGNKVSERVEGVGGG